jgi:hypothetical protein
MSDECHDHPWRYIYRDKDHYYDERWCPVCAVTEYTDDGDRWFS